MLLSRRDFVKHAAVASAAAARFAPARAAAAVPLPIRVGMTDWNLGKRGDVAKVALARQIGLDGIQVSLTFPADDAPHLRDPKVQAQFKQAALDNAIQICSLAIGSRRFIATASRSVSVRSHLSRRPCRANYCFFVNSISSEIET